MNFGERGSKMKNRGLSLEGRCRDKRVKTHRKIFHVYEKGLTNHSWTPPESDCDDLY